MTTYWSDGWGSRVENQTIGELIKTPAFRIHGVSKSDLVIVNERLAKFKLQLYQKPYPRMLIDPLNKEGGYIPALEESILCLNLSTRATNCLRLKGISTIDDLMGYEIEDLMKLRSLGKGTIAEIEKKLAELNLKLPSGKM